ncbi:MAG: MiaB/RimO family radical SAM methylthiotransferase [Anaerolineales bacterium]|nr:MiaB/RimO family radical SAM methylthiotransferase [Anaerolineales bacterium]
MKIFLDTIGCRLNQAEIETLARQFRMAGHEIVASAAGADLAVVNTCTVTGQAAADSRGRIRQAARLGAGRIVATGCWATLEPGAAAALPGVTAVVANLHKESLVPDLFRLPPETFAREPLARRPLPGQRARTRAFIKVQDGCDNACTFCITTVARGVSRSIPLAAVLADVQAALDGGTQEVVLTGVHLGTWGRDLGPSQRLPDLVSALLARTPVARLRLSSLEPWDLEADFFGLWKDERLCPHLHLPLQSGSAAVLRRMGRKTTPADYAGLVAAARTAISDVAITTDVIAGFPGESEAEFAETLDLLGRLDFAGGHVFPYSARPGTAAARMGGQVAHPVRRQRSAALREAFRLSAAAYRQRFVGRSLPVLWESARQRDEGGWQLEGLTGNYLRVTAFASTSRWNMLDRVRLDGLAETCLSGTIQ